MRKTILILLFIISINFYTYAADKDLQTLGFGFYKGMTSVNEEYADPNATVLIENYDFKEDGLLQARTGWFVYSELNSDSKIDNIFLYKNTNKGKYYIASTGKDLYSFTFQNSTKINIPYTLSAFNRRGFISQNNLLFIGDGVNENLKFNGDTIYKAGLIAPAAPPSLNLINDSTANITFGTYRYKYTYYSDTTGWNLLESTSNEDYAEIGIDTNSYVELSNIQISNNPLVTKRRIWRTKGIETALYYLVGTIDNNTDTTFIDNKNDTELSSVILDLTTIRDPMPPTNIFCENKGFLFAAGNQTTPYRLYWSNIYRPEYHNSVFDCWDEPDRQEITGLAKVNGHLIIFTKNKTYSLFIPNQTFTDFSTWYITLVNNAVGCINHNSIANIGAADAGIAFVSNQGIYGLGVNLYNNFVNNSVSGGNFDYFGVEVRNIFNQYISRFPTLVSGFFKDHRYYLAYSTNGLYNDRVLVFNTVSRAWSEYSGIYPQTFLYDIDEDALLYGTSLEDGKIIQLNGGNLYDGNIAMEYNEIIDISDEIQVNNKVETITINVDDGFYYGTNWIDTYQWYATTAGLLDYFYFSFNIPDTITNINKIVINYNYLGFNNNTVALPNDTIVIWDNILGNIEWIKSSNDTNFINIPPDTFIGNQLNISVGASNYEIPTNKLNNFVAGKNTLAGRGIFSFNKILGISSSRSNDTPTITIYYTETDTIKTNVISLKNRIISDTGYSDSALINFAKHQTAYFFKPNKEYFGSSPIVWNDSNSFQIKSMVYGIDTGFYVKTGTKNQVITTPFINCNMPTIQKLLQFTFIDIFASGGLLEVFTYFDNNDTYTYNQANVKISGSNWGDTGLTWGGGLTWGIIGNNQRRKIAFDNLSLFYRVKHKFFLNTFEPLIALNQYYILYKPLRTEYYDW